MHFADNLAVVACDSEGAPYALVIPVPNPAGQDPADIPPVVVYRREEGQWTEVFTWSYGYELWDKALFFDLAVDHNGGLWLPSLLGDGTPNGVISVIFHFDGSTWHIDVSPNESRLDNPRTQAGRALMKIPKLQIHKTLPPGYEQPTTTYPQEAERLLTSWSTDIDVAADGTVWISRPLLLPQRFNGEKWQSVIELQLSAHMIATLELLGSSRPPELATFGVLDGNGAPWLVVTGGVLHREEGRWMLYHLPTDDSSLEYLVPLATGADGSTWFWRLDRLLRYDGKIWQRFTGDENFGVTIGPYFIICPDRFWMPQWVQTVRSGSAASAFCPVAPHCPWLRNWGNSAGDKLPHYHECTRSSGIKG
jgi:hypothetical protein